MTRAPTRTLFPHTRQFNTRRSEITRKMRRRHLVSMFGPCLRVVRHDALTLTRFVKEELKTHGHRFSLGMPRLNGDVIQFPVVVCHVVTFLRHSREWRWLISLTPLTTTLSVSRIYVSQNGCVWCRRGTRLRRLRLRRLTLVLAPVHLAVRTRTIYQLNLPSNNPVVLEHIRLVNEHGRNWIRIEKLLARRKHRMVLYSVALRKQALARRPQRSK